MEQQRPPAIVGEAKGTAPLVSGSAVGRVIPYHDHLLDLADTLIAEGQQDRRRYALAVIVAGTSAEVFITRAFDRVLEETKLEWLMSPEVWGGRINFDLAGNTRLRHTYVALTGDAIQHEPVWQPYADHNRLRNGLVHGSQNAATEVEARNSVAAVRGLIAHVKQKITARWPGLDS